MVRLTSLINGKEWEWPTFVAFYNGALHSFLCSCRLFRLQRSRYLPRYGVNDYRKEMSTVGCGVAMNLTIMCALG